MQTLDTPLSSVAKTFKLPSPSFVNVIVGSVLSLTDVAVDVNTTCPLKFHPLVVVL